MKWILVVLALVGVGVVGMVWWRRMWIDPRGKEQETRNKNMEKYDFDSLKKRGGVVGGFKVLGKIKEVETRRRQGYGGQGKQGKYDFDTRQIRFQSEGKWIMGMMNYWPEKSNLTKMIIMVRGYAEKDGYYSGSGTWRVADKLAEAGYATISLDFLGYGGSGAESEDVLEARFEKVVGVLDLIETVRQLPWVDKDRIGIWAHSNGGQIVLSVLEITGQSYPTVLWAPMTQKFPDSVLSTIDEGSPVREEVERLMKQYDVRRYAFENYYSWIRAPILIQQGTNDEWCRVEWQEDLQSRLRSLGKQVKLVVYKGADHNLKQSWEEAVKRTVGFYDEELK